MSFFGGTKHGKISTQKINFKILKKKNIILFQIKHWIHLTKNWKTIQFQFFVWPKFSCKWLKNWCLPIYIYEVDIYCNENENNGLNNGKK
jgi:hypothetical protein